MGALCSKSSSLSGGHTLVSEGDGQSAAHERPSNPRAAAAQAAEQRLKTAQTRGVVSSKPNSGRLAAQVEASKSNVRQPQAREPEQLVWD